jgi:hypothetical protein
VTTGLGWRDHHQQPREIDNDHDAADGLDDRRPAAVGRHEQP